MQQPTTPLPESARTAIRARRIESGYSQPKAAEAAGISITTWNSIEKGRSSGAPLARAAICRLLGWTQDSIDRLERGEDVVELAAPAHDGGGVFEPQDGSMSERLAHLEREVQRLERALRRLAGDQLLGAP